MNDNSDTARFEQRASALLRDSVDALDGQTRSRLNRARQAALDELPAARRKSGLAPSRGFAMAVAMAVLAVGVWRLLPQGPVIEPAPVAAMPAPVEDMELLMAEENLEMLEDLEFFAWLSAEELSAADGAAG